MRAFHAFVTPIPLAITNPKPVTTTLGIFNPLGKIRKYRVFQYQKYSGHILQKANPPYSSLTKGE
jgi:hypothetical protein